MMTPGTKLGGRYRLDERIATGGMGDVWKATDEVLGRDVAVKVLLPSLLTEAGFIERFRAEARVVATLAHSNIVRVYDYGESPIEGGGGAAYLVMEFVSGEALTARLQREKRLSAAETLPIVAQAAEALHAAHEHGIIHRDVKPGNLLITPTGTVMLTDFGIARSAMTGGLTQAGSVMGTAAYVSPEQASGEPVTGQSDVYSLGVVTYQCLMGHRPFDSDSPVELAMRHVNDPPPPLPDDVPDEAKAVVDRALAKDVSQRFASGAEMAVAAREAAGLPPLAATAAQPVAGRDSAPRGSATPPPGQGLDSSSTMANEVVNPPTPPGTQQRRKVLLVAAIALLVVVLGAGGVWAVLGPGSADAGGGGGGTSESSQDNDDKTTIDAKKYLDQPPEDVEADLRDKGFKDVTVNGNGQFTADVTPNGEVDVSESITIEASLTPVGGSSSDPSGGNDGSCSAADLSCRTP